MPSLSVRHVSILYDSLERDRGREGLVYDGKKKKNRGELPAITALPPNRFMREAIPILCILPTRQPCSRESSHRKPTSMPDGTCATFAGPFFAVGGGSTIKPLPAITSLASTKNGFRIICFRKHHVVASWLEPHIVTLDTQTLLRC